MQGDNEYPILVLVALLHDIGKLIHRDESLYADKGQ